MTEIIIEVGLNHKGNLDIAKSMVEAVCIADADVVKFQTFRPDAVFNREDKNFKFIENLALSAKDHIKLAHFCKEMGIEFLSTPGDLGSLKFLVEEVGVKRIKIGSDDLTYKPLVCAAFDTGLPIILSTGMATIGEIRAAIQSPVAKSGELTLLHCVSLYPCPYELANLKAIEELRRFGYPVGYSDHVPGYSASVAAASLGATIIEKHFMLSDHRGCVDSAVSIDEFELVKLVKEIRQVELMLGDGFKYPSQQEAANILFLRKGKDGRRRTSVEWLSLV